MNPFFPGPLRRERDTVCFAKMVQPCLVFRRDGLVADFGSDIFGQPRLLTLRSFRVLRKACPAIGLQAFPSVIECKTDNFVLLFPGCPPLLGAIRLQHRHCRTRREHKWK